MNTDGPQTSEETQSPDNVLHLDKRRKARLADPTGPGATMRRVNVCTTGAAPGSLAAKAEAARRLLEMKRQFDDLVDGPLLSNPGWDILLDLFIQRCLQRTISVISVCIAANAPTSTVLRYVEAMIDSGTIVRSPTSDDSQGMQIALSEDVFERLNAMLG